MQGCGRSLGCISGGIRSAHFGRCKLGHLIRGRGNHALGIGGQDILRTLIVKEAVETCEPERQPPAILRSSEYLENLRHLFAGTMISRIEAIQRQLIFPAELDREDLPVALPLARLQAQVGRTETGKLCHFGRWQKIAAIQDSLLGLNEYASLLARSLRRRDIG
jgi:hypothetical protein